MGAGPGLGLGGGGYVGGDPMKERAADGALQGDVVDRYEERMARFSVSAEMLAEILRGGGGPVKIKKKTRRKV